MTNEMRTPYNMRQQCMAGAAWRKTAESEQTQRGPAFAFHKSCQILASHEPHFTASTAQQEHWQECA